MTLPRPISGYVAPVSEALNSAGPRGIPPWVHVREKRQNSSAQAAAQFRHVPLVIVNNNIPPFHIYVLSKQTRAPGMVVSFTLPFPVVLVGVGETRSCRPRKRRVPHFGDVQNAAKRSLLTLCSWHVEVDDVSAHGHSLVVMHNIYANRSFAWRTFLTKGAPWHEYWAFHGSLIRRPIHWNAIIA